MKNLFATQVHHHSLKSSKSALKTFLSDLKHESFQIEQMDHAGHLWSEKNYKNGYTSYGSLDRLHRMSSTFQELEKDLNKHVAQFLKKLDYDIKMKDLRMTHCWVNIMPAGTQHAAHIHPQSVISGTFYVSIPKGASSIKFEDPRMGLFMNAPVVKPSARLQNQRFIEVKPTAGDVVLFESWLRHEVPQNTTKDPRISISFNYGWA